MNTRKKIRTAGIYIKTTPAEKKAIEQRAKENKKTITRHIVDRAIAK